MRTVAETPVFTRYAAAVWGDAEREAFIAWIAEHAFAGDALPAAFLARLKREIDHEPRR